MTRRSPVNDQTASRRPAARAASAWDVFTGCLMLAPQTRDDLAQMQAVLPGYQVSAARRGSSWRFEAVRRPDGPKSGPWCVISSDPADLWRELDPWTRRPPAPTASGGTLTDSLTAARHVVR